jgi:hypothetical protein
VQTSWHWQVGTVVVVVLVVVVVVVVGTSVVVVVVSVVVVVVSVVVVVVELVVVVVAASVVVVGGSVVVLVVVGDGHTNGKHVKAQLMSPTSHCAILRASPMLQARSPFTSQTSG